MQLRSQPSFSRAFVLALIKNDISCALEHKDWTNAAKAAGCESAHGWSEPAMVSLLNSMDRTFFAWHGYNLREALVDPFIGPPGRAMTTVAAHNIVVGIQITDECGRKAFAALKTVYGRAKEDDTNTIISRLRD